MVRDQTDDAPFASEERPSLLFGCAVAFFLFAKWRLGARYLELCVEPTESARCRLQGHSGRMQFGCDKWLRGFT